MSDALDNTQALSFTGEGMTAADDVVQRLEQLNAIGASLSAERDINRLLETILTAAKSLRITWYLGGSYEPPFFIVQNIKQV